MFNEIRNMLLYAGVDRFNYQRVKPDMQKANRTMTIVVSTFALLLISVMIVFSLETEALSQNRDVYLYGLIVTLVILILSTTIAKKDLRFVTPLVYAAYLIYYSYGILIGIVTDANQKTVTFMVLLVFLPTLFIDKPIRSISITVIFTTVFEILCFLNKEGTVLIIDAVDAIIFGILGSATGVVMNAKKIKGYVIEHKLREISKIDQLTQLKNRNAFELELDLIPSVCRHNLACIYIDANGLHEINNTRGHEFGDNMLKSIASEVQYAFSEEYSYRIGGDEFVAFVPDTSEKEIDEMISEMIRKLQYKSFSVAIGCEVAKVKHLSIYELIKNAEYKMFQDKKEHYKNIAFRNARNDVL